MGNGHRLQSGDHWLRYCHKPEWDLRPTVPVFLCPLLGLDLLLVLKPRQGPWGRDSFQRFGCQCAGVLTNLGHLPVFSGLGKQPVGVGFLFQLEGRTLLGIRCPHPMCPCDFYYTVNKPTPVLNPREDGGGGHKLGLALGLQSQAAWLLSFLSFFFL